MASQSSLQGLALARDQGQDQHPIQMPSHHSHTPPKQLISSKLQPRKTPLISTSSSRTFSSILIPTNPSFLFLLLIICLSTFNSVSAATIYIPEQMVESPYSAAAAAAGGRLPQPEDLRSALERLAQSGPILVDLSPPPRPGAKEWTLATVADDMRRRRRRRRVGEDQSSVTPSSTTAKKESPSATPTGEKASGVITKPASTGTSNPTASSSGGFVVETEAANSSPLPTAFDNGFNNNITDSCATFMDSMLKNSSFVNCLPFSLLLKTSTSFFQASRSITLITRTLDASCSANATQCNALLTTFSNSINKPTNCASDLSNENPLILQAQLGLQAYLPLYTASCLRNPVTSAYCFADAVTNKTSPTDTYIYRLPLNVSLPGGSQPTCNQCLVDTMAVLGASTGVVGPEGNALRSTYVDAAEQINVKCGPQFVNSSLATTTSSFGARSVQASGFEGMGVLALAVVVGSWLF